MDTKNLRNIAYQCILELSTEDGIQASGRNEVYGCIFGRDGAKSVLKMMKVYAKTGEQSLIDIAKRTLLTLVNLQGRETNIESGEQPGKFIHEFRRDNYERLLKLPVPWFIYPDGTLRNYDSLDATPLALIAIYRYWEITKDNEFLLSVLPHVEAGLNWLISYADLDHDQLIEYEFSKDRKYGGLKVQSWTDSHESILQPNGKLPLYPIAPVEAQGYAWLALRLWADFYGDMKINFAQKPSSKNFSKKLLKQAKEMKKRFNDVFIFRDNDLNFAAQILDGDKNQIKTVTGNPLLLLWSTYEKNGSIESILETKYVEDLVTRSFQSDMFDPESGIRTMSSLAPTFNPNLTSYHNGSFWPILNGLIYEGLEKWGYKEKAGLLREASLKPIAFFGSPIELYVKTQTGYALYHGHDGQESCRQQAWSAAAALDMLTL